MSGQAMIAYLPSNGRWCKQDLPHMTLVYAGETHGRPESEFNSLAKDAITVARLTGSFSLSVTGVEVFGEGPDAVDVLTLHPTPQLLVARNTVKDWNASEFTDYKPHATIGPVGSAAEFQTPQADPYSDGNVGYDGPRRRGLPLSLYFNKVGAFWDDKQIVFDLSEPY